MKYWLIAVSSMVRARVEGVDDLLIAFHGRTPSYEETERDCEIRDRLADA